MTIVFSRVTGGFVEEVDGQFLITVGDGQPGDDDAGFYGWDDGSLGSIDPDPPVLEGETLDLFFWNPVDFDGITGLWEVQFVSDALDQDFFESVEIVTSTATISFNSADADFFTTAFGGTRWRFEWDGTNRWGENDEGLIRAVTFTMPELV